jgi:predicted amidohydrolase YtcJ
MTSWEIGKFADMVVLDRDLLMCSDAEIAELKALQTYVDGELVFERE